MAESRVLDPSRLHLKKELTQIRKAARVLRDPGTTSSWKSPLNTSRSAAATTVVESARRKRLQQDKEFVRQDISNDADLNDHFDSCRFTVNSDNVSGKDKEKRVFLYNWKNQKSVSKNEEDEGSLSVNESPEDCFSDARNVVGSKSDIYTAETRSASNIFRCRDATDVTLGKRFAGISKKSKKHRTHLEVISRHKRKENLRLPQGHNSLALKSVRDVSAVQSDETDEYSTSEGVRKGSVSSPLLLKLRQKNWAHSSSKLLRTSRKEDTSYSHSTPALSTASYNRHNRRNPSTIGSWDATTTSFNDGDDEGDDNLDFSGRSGCGIPCYWSKRNPKHRGVCGSCYSPSFSDTLRRKGSSILCGSQSMYPKRRNSQGLVPLLSKSVDGKGGSSLGIGCSDDDLSTNFGELDLEALSRLDGRRWSSCRSQDGLETEPLNEDRDEDGTPDTNIGSLSHKYKPICFDELIGQNMVVQALVMAISLGRIAPFYLFQGPRGTGKTSAARIFAAALNCQSTEETKPCGQCRDCSDLFSGKSRDLWEVDGGDKKTVEQVIYILKKVSRGLQPVSSKYKTFVVDESHLLPTKTWLAFLKYVEEPPQRVVFIFTTTDSDNVPRPIHSRCQKYLFNKIKDSDMKSRLKKISALENLDVETDALDLIVLNADCSLRDAETMLDQLSLLGRKITTSLVNELVGIVSDEKLLELLELALSSNTIETVKIARELMDSGVDPIVLMSQLASLIMDIIAGTYNIIDDKYNDPIFGGRSLTEAELEKLKHALKLLSEAEKQIRVSSERSTWFTAALLQLGSVPSPDLTLSSSSRRQSSRTTAEDQSSVSREARYYPKKSISPGSLNLALNGSSGHQREISTQADSFGGSKLSHSQLLDGHSSSVSTGDALIGSMYFRNLTKLDDIWAKCIEKCHSKTLKQLLHTHGKLLSISETEGILVAYVAFGDASIKSRAERFMSSITNSFEVVLKSNVEVRIIPMSVADDLMNHMNAIELPAVAESDTDFVAGIKRGAQEYYNSPPVPHNSIKSTTCSPALLAETNSVIGSTKSRRQELPMQRIESIIREQRLETAWLQAVEKGTPGSLSLSKPEKNQILPQEGIYIQTQTESDNSMRVKSQHLEDELNQELKVLKMQDRRTTQNDLPSKRVDRFPMSPSQLHSKEILDYESGTGKEGCSGLLCWNTTRRTHKRGKVKGTPRSQSSRFSLFDACTKPSRSKRQMS